MISILCNICIILCKLETHPQAFVNVLNNLKKKTIMADFYVLCVQKSSCSVQYNVLYSRYVKLLYKVQYLERTTFTNALTFFERFFFQAVQIYFDTNY